MAPQGISMAPILQALQRRQQGGAAPMAGQQMSAPPQSQASAGSMPLQVQQGSSAQGAQGSQTTQATNAGQQAQGPQFDSETRDLAKSLVQRLIKGI